MRKLLAFARDLLNSDYAGHRLTFQLFAQSPPEDLAGCVFRQRVDKANLLRDLERCDLLPAELAQRRGVVGAARPQHNTNTHSLALDWVGRPIHGGLGDQGVLVEHLLDLDGVYEQVIDGAVSAAVLEASH